MARSASNRNPEPERRLDARRDTVDFRDQMYVPTLVEVPLERTLDDYRRSFGRGRPRILDQGQEGACTGFGLAAVADFLLQTRRVRPDADPVSPAMLYAMARRYDEWPGERYDGSSARGAMKGWHKHGVCSETLWPYRRGTTAEVLSDARAKDARQRPLGAYFRVDARDLVALHAALAEVGIVYATCDVHAGWSAVGADGLIEQQRTLLGGHAFAIVGYDRRGLWIQNSWGPRWGRQGFCQISYDDWLENGSDVWVARLGVPTDIGRAVALARGGDGSTRERFAFADLRPHIVSVGNDGLPRPNGDYGTSADDIRAIVGNDLRGWLAAQRKGQRRVLLYAHGGLVAERDAVQRVADTLQPLLAENVYPLSFIWHSDAWSTLTDILRDGMRGRRPEGILDAAKDFMLDRLDDTLEPIARHLGGKALWDEMKENATAATTNERGAARLVATELAALASEFGDLEVHLVGHSAGSIFLAPLIEQWTGSGTVEFQTAPPTPEADPSSTARPRPTAAGLGKAIASCTLWAPACTLAVFRRSYLPAMRSGAIGRLALFTLGDRAEQDDDCGGLYHKSLLYLVARALEVDPASPLGGAGTPLLGMETFVRSARDVREALAAKSNRWTLAPNSDAEAPPLRSDATHHGDFDDDPATQRSTLAFILNPAMSARSALRRAPGLEFRPGASRRRELRRRLERPRP